MQYSFGTGTLIGVCTDIADATPAIFGTVQDVGVDFEFTAKELYGQYQAPVAIARGEMKISGKAQFARIYSQTFNSLFFGQSAATGGILQAVNEAATVPSSSPYEVTVENAASFATDLGVFYAATGVQLTRTASGPAQGEYSVSAAGVYTFNTADASQALLINYTYESATGVTKIALANQLMGAAPTFQMNLTETQGGKIFNLQLNACVAAKLSLPFKAQDFTIAEMDFQAMQDAAGNIGTLTTSE